MSFSVQMPALGESVTEGTVTRWLKQEGDTVEVDEPLLEVSTDKVDTEIPSPAAGVLTKITAHEDDVVEIGGEIAVIGDGADDTSTQPDTPSSGAVAQNDKTANPATPDAREPAQKPVVDADSTGSDATTVTMPELGESVTEGTVTRWLKQVGDDIAEDEPLLEVSTDKVDTEIPSPVAGTLLKIIANEDDTVNVGGDLALVGSADAAPTPGSSTEAAPADPAPAQTETPNAEPVAEADEPVEAPSTNTAEPAKKPVADAKSQSGDGTTVTMPELGESVTEGTVTRWLKQVGDDIAEDEPLLEVSTDKVDTEIPSPVAGTLLKIIANEDDTVNVGGDLAVIGSGSVPQSESTSDDDAGVSNEAKTEAPASTRTSDDSSSKPTSPKPSSSGETEGPTAISAAAATPAPRAVNPSGTPYVTPLVRKLAAEHNVDLNTVKGTGVGGRIRKQDVLAAAGGSDQASAQDTAAAPTPAPKPVPKGARPELADLAGTTRKINRIRQITAKKTRESLQESAQLTQVFEADMTKVWALRAAHKSSFATKHGVNLTFLPFFAKAVVEALKLHPNVNASIDEAAKEITYHGTVNLGIAVDTPQGLLSPVIHNAGDLSLPELAAKISDLAERTRNNKLKPDELAGGTFTITNIGSQGALFDTPILVPPQAAMLGTGAIIKRPTVLVEEDGTESIAIRAMCYLPLTYDHRLIDGADAGRFLTTIKQRLEDADFVGDLDL